MWLDFEEKKIPRLRSPAMLVSLSTSMPQYVELYSQGRELADYLLKWMKFDPVANIKSSAFPPETLVREDGTVSMIGCTLYLSRGKRDLLLLAGDSSPAEDQYEFSRSILEYAKGVGVKEVYSVGARWTENPVLPDAEQKVKGFSSDRTGVSALRRAGVEIIEDEPAPFFSSMVVSMSGERGIRGYKLSVDHGEPRPHTRSVRALLRVLGPLAKFEPPLRELDNRLALSTRSANPGDASIYH